MAGGYIGSVNCARGSASGHNFKAAEVHLDPIYRSDAERRYRCFRCERLLPSGQFPRAGAILRERVAYTVLSGKCWTCRKDLKSQFAGHPLLTPVVCRWLRKRLLVINGAAQRRGLVSSLLEDDLHAMWVVQQGRCAITGIPMDCADVGNKAPAAPSVDRIDSAGNYTVDNTHLVCYAINIMKNDMPLDRFKRWCALVVAQDVRDIAAGMPND